MPQFVILDDVKDHGHSPSNYHSQNYKFTVVLKLVLLKAIPEHNNKRVINKNRTL